MDLKNLTTFIHVAELGSFTKAGTILGYSQSTVSFQIRQLEEELQFPLFERINHTVALTEKGREVLTYAHEVSRMTSALKTNRDYPVSGHVRLAMSDSICNSLFADPFQSFREKYPGITLKITTAGTQELFRLVDHNEADAILTLDSHVYNTEYIIVREEKLNTHFVVSASSPLANRSEITPEELVSMPFILTEKGMSYRRLLDEQLAQRSLEIRPIMEIGNTNIVCNLVKQGIGISFLPDFVTQEDVDSNKMCYLHVSGLDVTVWKQLLYHRDKWLSPQIQSVLQYCTEKEFHI